MKSFKLKPSISRLYYKVDAKKTNDHIFFNKENVVFFFDDGGCSEALPLAEFDAICLKKGYAFIRVRRGSGGVFSFSGFQVCGATSENAFRLGNTPPVLASPPKSLSVNIDLMLGDWLFLFDLVYKYGFRRCEFSEMAQAWANTQKKVFLHDFSQLDIDFKAEQSKINFQ